MSSLVGNVHGPLRDESRAELTRDRLVINTEAKILPRPSEKIQRTKPPPMGQRSLLSIVRGKKRYYCQIRHQLSTSLYPHPPRNHESATVHRHRLQQPYRLYRTSIFASSLSPCALFCFPGTSVLSRKSSKLR